MRILVQDLRAAFRSLRARPAYVVVAVITLALGIGATTAVFSVVDALMLRPLPYRDPQRVVNFEGALNGQAANISFSFDGLRVVRDRHEVFEGVEAYYISNQVMTGGAEPLPITLLQTTPGLLSLLGTMPQLGRVFQDDDARGATGPGVVLSHGLWVEQFGSDAAILGRRVLFDDVPHVVIGVMPRGFAFPRPGTRGWTLIPSSPPQTRPRLSFVARLRDGVGVQHASSVVGALAPRLEELNAITRGRVPTIASPSNINTTERMPVLFLLGAVAFVLAIACANVASMALANGSVRQRELAICAALGASRWRIARQLLTESALVSLIGGAAGIWLAVAGVQALVPLMPTSLTFWNVNEIRIDYRIVLFAAAAAALTVFITGVLPAFRNSRAEVGEVLKSGGRTSSGSAAERRTLATLGVVQCALAVLLLASAALLVTSFLRLQSVAIGFDPTNLVVLKIPVPTHRYADAAAQQALRTAIVDRLRSTPGVVGVTFAGGMPPSGGAFSFNVDLETDRASGVAATDVEFAFNPVDADYFTVMGIRVLAGRALGPVDGENTVVINDVFARRFWTTPGEAIGRRFRVAAREPWQTIVGVAADVKQYGLDDRAGELEYYHAWPTTGRGWSQQNVAVRIAGDTASMIPVLKRGVWAIDPSLPMRESVAMNAMIASSIARPRFFFLLMTMFAGVAAAVAAAGIYGLFSYTVARRTHEIGIRLAMGASPRQVGSLVMRQAVLLSAAGAAIGLAASWATSQALSSLLFQTSPTDPIALASGGTGLIALSALACYVPARRAQRVDPLVMLKVE